MLRFLIPAVFLCASCGCRQDTPPPQASDGTTLHLLTRLPEATTEQPALIQPQGDMPGYGSWGASDGGGWSRTMHEMGGQPYLTTARASARLILPATHAAPRQLHLALWCQRVAGSDNPTASARAVRIRLNNIELAPDGLDVTPKPGAITLEAPEPCWLAGENVLELAVEERVHEGMRAWDTLALASVSYGPAETVSLDTLAETARFEPRTGARYALELSSKATLELGGTSGGSGELRVRRGLLHPQSGEHSFEEADALSFAVRGGVLEGHLTLPRRTGAVQLIELEWAAEGEAELLLTRLDVHEGGAPPRPPIVFVSIDTFAARHLSLYGYGRRTSPMLEELQKDAIVFERCLANAPWTLPSYLSVMSGLYPRAHDVSVVRQAGAEPDIFGDLFLAPNRWTLAEALRARGYRTGGFVDTMWLSPLYGMRQGFDLYNGDAALALFSDMHAGIEMIVTKLVPTWLDEARPERPPFLFLHALDAHGPYLSEDPFFDTFSSALGPERTMKPSGSLNQTYRAIPHWMGLTLHQNEKEPMPEEMPNEEIIARYDETLLKVDAYLGQLFAELRARELYDEAVIVITGDHGETFGPAVWGHGVMREDVLHVPLILKLPYNARGGERVSRPVSLVDVYPTLLELAGVPPEPSRLHGTSLLTKQDRPAPTLYSESGWVEQYTLTEGRWRLVEERPGSESADYSLLTHPRVPAEWLRQHYPEVLAHPLTQTRLTSLRERPGFPERIAELRTLVAGPYFSLFDIEADPGQQEDVSASHPEVVERLKPLLQLERRRSLESKALARPGASLPDLGEDAQKALEALGYGGGK